MYNKKILMSTSSLEYKLKKEGFTLLELLIVIGILAILGAVVIFVLNPAETLRETRDSQRISDLSTIKTALGLYLTSTSTPYLGSNTANSACKSSPGAAYAAGNDIFFSAATDVSSSTDVTLDGGSAGSPGTRQTSSTNYRKVDATGWIPVNLSSLTAGSPLDTWPVDPTNSFVTGTSTAAAVNGSALVYRYACAATPLTFEVDARLEATKNATLLTTDGGNNGMLYESGTNLTILGGGDF